MITYISKDMSVTYQLAYITGRRLRGYRGDKTFPKVTQCLLYYNGLLQGFGEVVKCDEDDDNPDFAKMLATKKVMHLVWCKEARVKLWELLKEDLKNNN